MTCGGVDRPVTETHAMREASTLPDDREEGGSVLSAARGPEPSGLAEDLLSRLATYAARQGSATAVEAPEGTLSYAQLHHLSSMVGRRLSARGVGRDSPVVVAHAQG